MKGLVPTAQHYEEALPNENASVKESEAQLQSTQERLAKMRFEALKQGILLTCTSKAHLKESQQHFQEKELPKHPDAPRLKMKDLIMDNLTKRIKAYGQICFDWKPHGKKDPA